MPNREKYTDFVELNQVMRSVASSAGEEGENVLYTVIQCPHCPHKFEMPSDAVRKNKSSRCLEHLRVCKEYDGEVAPVKKQRVTNEDLARKLDEMRKEAAEREKEAAERERRIISTISETTNLGPPPPTNADDLYVRLGEKQEQEMREKTEIECRRANMDNWNHVSTCSVCMDKPSDTLFNPCAHRNVCWDDWKALEAAAVAGGFEPKCPTCRVVIKGAVRLAM